VGERLRDRSITLELTYAAKEELVREGYDRVYGARPLRRTVERRVENPLSRRILASEFKDGDHVRVDFREDSFVFEKAAAPAPEPVAGGVA
jgi:ATP-dependent Clp protease ATP-binding subunit ClpC